MGLNGELMARASTVSDGEWVIKGEMGENSILEDEWWNFIMKAKTVKCTYYIDDESNRELCYFCNNNLLNWE